MGLSKHYKTLTIEGYIEPYFNNEGGYAPRGTFKGLIQLPDSRSFTNIGFNNSKDTNNISAILFCSEKQQFEPKDIIVNTDGTKYKIHGRNLQPDGITGIKPKRGQHAEYSLVYAQEAFNG